MVKTNRPAPKMKEAVLSTNKWRELYVQCIRMMRTMYQQCRLVHGDLSEYNILYALPLCCGPAAHAWHSLRVSRRVRVVSCVSRVARVRWSSTRC